MQDITSSSNFVLQLLINSTMSSSAQPISPTRFAAALTSLPLPNLHLKAAELRNSIAHLEYSNIQLQHFVEEGDRDCREAIDENEETIMRMEERIALLKKEVEGRGFAWGDEGVGGGDEANEKTGDKLNGNTNEQLNINGQGEVEQAISRSGESLRSVQNVRGEGGRLGDEELARRLRERMAEDMMDEDDDGLHL